MKIRENPWPILGIQRLFAELSAFRQQRHGVHQILQGDDSHQALVFYYRNDAEIFSGQLAEGGSQGFAFLGDVEYSVHHRLDVAVTFGA